MVDSAVKAAAGRITVLDFESTGTVPGYANEPWQIGFVSLSAGRVDVESMSEYLIRIDPARPFNPHAPGRHAQLRDELAQAPALEQVWRSVQPHLIGVPLCAHNIGTEKKFTRLMAPMHQFGPWIDTLKIARKAWPGCASYALDELIVLLGLKPDIDSLCPGREAHDALYDAVASAKLLEYLLLQTGWGDLTIAEFAAF